MFNNLTERETSAANKLLEFGLSKAATAFQSILRSEATLKSITTSLETVSDVPQYCTKADSKTHLLKTELVGDLKGFCHLIFSESEVQKIQNAGLPEEILLNNNPETRLMKLEYLTEIDNMVAGSVITQLANFLDLEIYGNVPSLHVMQANEVNKYIQAESVVYKSKVEFRAIFSIPHLGVAPEFVWLLQESFIEKVKANAEQILAKELV
ncbi:chemotaxis protein CheC [Reichenbachiella carrageenanivorans]|uniref:Chemotaxis protein CheC n=1 Tax=Reichenbachiella carrageenanivorans TaxID=2979869 RepID=A0ABY6D003_9BACT|nr:chemotaxis protein CheC [Reichenbachiella carrageenanivorans]UXX79501.1 chemotaxis protein CheC [Reichenbachiella carrageenanivorans]